MNGLVQWFLTGEARLPWGAYVNFQGGAIVNMFYNTFFTNFGNQNDRKLDFSKNQIEQQNLASFF